MPQLPLVGDEFAGYRMRAVLGRGGMSVVYQAENLRLSNVIALKVLAPELAANDVERHIWPHPASSSYLRNLPWWHRRATVPAGASRSACGRATM
jgi:serine/threonine protein kinase